MERKVSAKQGGQDTAYLAHTELLLPPALAAVLYCCSTVLQAQDTLHQHDKAGTDVLLQYNAVDTICLAAVQYFRHKVQQKCGPCTKCTAEVQHCGLNIHSGSTPLPSQMCNSSTTPETQNLLQEYETAVMNALQQYNTGNTTPAAVVQYCQHQQQYIRTLRYCQGTANVKQGTPFILNKPLYRPTNICSEPSQHCNPSHRRKTQ